MNGDTEIWCSQWVRQLDASKAHAYGHYLVTSGPLKSSTQNLILPSVSCKRSDLSIIIIIIIERHIHIFLDCLTDCTSVKRSREAAQDASSTAYETRECAQGMDPRAPFRRRSCTQCDGWLIYFEHQRAQELIAVEQSPAALTILHEHVTSKRSRNSPITSLEPVMIQFVELCVDLKKGKLAKDGLYQYKNTAQNTNVGTIEVS